ncbi:hypothetical protein A2U01_0076157, partial [Trifolium medium]|nr:hypothetical protein [Trifolium medium]
ALASGVASDMQKL